MAIQAQLDRVRQVGADFEERRPPVAILEIKVEMVDEDGLPGEVETDASGGRRTLLALERGAPLLSHPKENHSLLTGVGLAHRVGHLVFALAPLEAHQWNLLSLDELPDRLAKPLPELTEKRGRGDRVTQVLLQEVDQLTRTLKLRHIAVDIDPIHTTDLQTDLICENLRDGRAHGYPPLLGRSGGTILPYRLSALLSSSV